MTASDDLLRRLERDEELASLPLLHRDFDIKRRDPVEELALANGLSLTPVAGGGAGGTYFLCGARYEPGFVPACVTHDGGPYRHHFDQRRF